MTRFSFIIASEAYLLRKGIAHLLGRLPGTRVAHELDSPEAIERYLQHAGGHFLIISEALFQESETLLMDHPSLLERSLVLVKHEAGELLRKFSLPCVAENAPKEELLEKLQALLEQHSDGKDQAENQLTPREQTIVKLVSLGMTNKQIADELFLSTHTVITHRKNIASKLGIKSASGLTIYAIVNNLVTIEEASSKAGQ